MEVTNPELSLLRDCAERACATKQSRYRPLGRLFTALHAGFKLGCFVALLALLVMTFFNLCITIPVVLASEMRAGVLAHDLGNNFKQRYEKGYDINLEYLFNEEYKFLFARPHIGANLNTGGYTSNVYAGITWHLDIFSCGTSRHPEINSGSFKEMLPPVQHDSPSSSFEPSIFIEVSFGGGIHNGGLKKPKKKRALGSRALFRESISLGVLLQNQHSVELIVDHLSNAGIVKPNPGLTNVGIRYGYKF